MRELITVTVGAVGADFPGFSNKEIQAAINYVASLGGGEVLLSAGTYALADSVHMKTGVTLRGAGRDTILLKDEMVASETVEYYGYGHCEIEVAHPERFRVGMGVYITDGGAASGGFLATQSTVVSISGGVLGLADPLCCDVGGPRGGKCRTLFPLVKGAFEKNFAVRDLVLDGNREKNESIDGCRGGCIFLIGCSYVEMTGLECRNYANDGISYQQCYDILTENCELHHNSCNGMHPGSGTILSTIRNCHVHHNDADGVFYCLRTQYLTLENCLIEDNHRFGITVGHHDHYTDIIGNTIRNNGWEGLFFRNDLVPYGSGSFSTVTRNRFENNGYTDDEKRVSEIHFTSAVKGLRVYDNTVINDGKIALLIDEPTAETFIYDNNFTPTLKDAAAKPEDWYSAEKPAKERFITDFPITEDTLAHLRHICR